MFLYLWWYFHNILLTGCWWRRTKETERTSQLRLQSGLQLVPKLKKQISHSNSSALWANAWQGGKYTGGTSFNISGLCKAVEFKWEKKTSFFFPVTCAGSNLWQKGNHKEHFPTVWASAINCCSYWDLKNVF